MMTATGFNLAAQPVSRGAPRANFGQRAEDTHGLRCSASTFFTLLTLRNPPVSQLKKARGRRTSAILLPPFGTGDFTYGRQAMSTSPAKLDVEQLLQYSIDLKTAGKELLPDLSAFKQPTEMFPEIEAATIQQLVPLIKQSLKDLGRTGGEISVSAYDTAWIARIQDADGKPQFPRTLEWIVSNQQNDGSWGDEIKPWVYDRFIRTLSCIVALKSWNHSPVSVQNGVDYIRKNASKLEDEEILRMPIGFELSFPALLAEAKVLGLDLPYDTPFFQTLEELGKKKLQRVPLELLHSQPTTLLHTLEGLQSLNINWTQVLKFLSKDGSMCCSPSSTAVLYMHTGDKKCLSFLQSVVLKFDDAVPTCYPLDTFHDLWVVDTLERLGIARYFQTEIEEVLASVFRHWSDEQGICWARVLKDVPDLDDTSMAFRLLREHGYSVSAEAFRGFQKDKGFVCFAVGQMVQGVSDMYNLLRASQTAYPGEQRLDDAATFSKEFLVDALTNDKGNADKWSLKKDLAGEVDYALKNPEYRSLKRIEVRHYLDKYGPEDVWIGKSIYRLRLVNNHDYLALAKADFNLCQMLHQKELSQILRWISNSGIADSSIVRERIVTLYAMFSAEVWEPELSDLRIAAGKSMFIAMAMHQLFLQQSVVGDLRQLLEAVKRWNPSRVEVLPDKFSSVFMMLFDTVNESAVGVADANDHIGQLVHIWENMLSSFLFEAECRAYSLGVCSTRGALTEFQKKASTSIGLEAIALSSILMSREINSSHFVTWMEKDSTFLQTVSEAVSLAQGIAANKDHLGTLVAVYPSCLPENKDFPPMKLVEAGFTAVKEQMNKELNWQQRQLSTVPQIVKRVLMSFTKVANVYYEGNYLYHEQESQFQLRRLAIPLQLQRL